jgi:hypothetical protein
MSQQIDLTSAQAKLRHAEEHISTLRTFIDTARAQKENQPGVGAELDTATGIYILRITYTPDLAPIAEKVSLIVGDVVHNLRSALDHLAWQLACDAAGGTPRKPKEVVFPICDPPQPGKTCKTPSCLATANWQNMHEFEPCKGLNNRPDGWSASYVHQLTLLRELSNDDKHKTLPVTLILTDGLNLMMRTRVSLPPWLIKTEEGFDLLPERRSDPDPDDDRPDFTHASFKAEVGAEVCRQRAPAWKGRTVIEHVGTATPQIALEERRAVVATMERLTEYVRLVLDAF